MLYILSLYTRVAAGYVLPPNQWPQQIYYFPMRVSRLNTFYNNGNVK